MLFESEFQLPTSKASQFDLGGDANVLKNIFQFFQSSWQPGKDTKQMAQKAGLKYGMTSEEAEAAAANAESWASVSWAEWILVKGSNLMLKII